METWSHRGGDVETWRHRHETWKDGEMETWRHGYMDMETWAWRHGRRVDMEHGHGGMETWSRRHGHGNMDMETKSEGRFKTKAQTTFLNPFTMCSSCERKFAVCPFIDEETNGSYPFANRLNRLKRLYGLAHQYVFVDGYCTLLAGVKDFQLNNFPQHESDIRTVPSEITM